MPEFKPLRGMRDLLVDETKQLTSIIDQARETAKEYNYDEVITPVLESHDLVSAKSGDDIRTRMFTFKDLGNRIVALRPEFTASIARLATTVLKKSPKPLRVFSVGSVYRYDEPQQGRYREFWQSNFELMGSDKPEADAELILLTNNLLKKTGLHDYFFKVGHIGIIKGILTQEKIDEKTQNKILQQMDKKEYANAFELLDNNTRSILKGLISIEGNSLFETIEKIKNHVRNYEKAKTAADNLLNILELVTKCDCPIKSIEPAFSRGLEYYTGMIFEILVPNMNISLGGGGRYDRLIELFGGISTPAVGVAHGIDRISLALRHRGIKAKDQNLKRVLVVPITQDLKIKALSISEELRNSGIFVEFEVMGKKIGNALEYASKRQIDFVVLVGKSELKTNSVVLRNLAKHEQVTVKIENLALKIRE